MNEGHIFIDEQITPDTLKMVKANLAEFERTGVEAIVLHIQSPGGSVYAGYNIYNSLKLSGKPIRTIIEGEAQSMATFIAILGSPKLGGLGVEICNPSVFMIHMPHSGVEGTAEQFEQGASELRTIENEMIEAYSSVSDLPSEKIREMMRRTTTLNAKQAKEMGFASKVLGSYREAVALGQTILNPNKGKMSEQSSVAKDKKILIDIMMLAANALAENQKQ